MFFLFVNLDSEYSFNNQLSRLPVTLNMKWRLKHFKQGSVRYDTLCSLGFSKICCKTLKGIVGISDKEALYIHDEILL